jgi:hypothetical protein
VLEHLQERRDQASTERAMITNVSVATTSRERTTAGESISYSHKSPPQAADTRSVLIRDACMPEEIRLAQRGEAKDPQQLMKVPYQNGDIGHQQ